MEWVDVAEQESDTWQVDVSRNQILARVKEQLKENLPIVQDY